METNEIKSYRTSIPLEEYLKLIDLEKVEKTEKAIGTIYYSFLKTPIKCQHKTTNDVCFVIAYRHIQLSRKSIMLCIVNNNLMEYELGMLVTYVELVLKEQIKNLKYVEQLNLFKDGEKDNG